MRIKILVLGDNPVSLVSDCQLMKDRGLLVFTAFNLQNINEVVREIKPDVVFFDIHTQNEKATYAYNEFVNGIEFTHIPVIYTLSDDDVYLVTRKRTAPKEKRNIIADNIMNAVKMALLTPKVHIAKASKKAVGIGYSVIQLPVFPARA